MMCERLDYYLQLQGHFKVTGFRSSQKPVWPVSSDILWGGAHVGFPFYTHPKLGVTESLLDKSTFEEFTSLSTVKFPGFES